MQMPHLLLLAAQAVAEVVVAAVALRNGISTDSAKHFIETAQRQQRMRVGYERLTTDAG
jgi:hypothetical protein